MLYHKSDKGLLYYGDVLNEITAIPTESVDLIITSPPYNLGNNHHTGNKKTGCYDDYMPEDEYQQWQIEVINECYRVLKSGGSMFYNHKNRIKNGVQISPYEWLFKTDMLIKQEIVWVNRSQNFDKIRFYPWTERVYWLTKSPKTKLFNNINHSDVFNWTPVGTKGAHTRAFPIQMPLDIISCFPAAQSVLDPFMGSGTVARAAEIKGIYWVGIERDKNFCEIVTFDLSLSH